MEQKEKINKVVFSYIYKDHINRVYNFIKTPDLFHSALKKANEISYSKGKLFSEVGMEVIYGWKNILLVKLQVIENIDTPDYKKISLYTLDVKPVSLTYTLNWHFYRNSVENSTLFMSEMIFENEEAMKIMDFKYDYQDKVEIYSEIDRLLSLKTEGLDQFESVIINAAIEEVWNIFTDWTRLTKIVPLIADKVTYEGDTQELGTKIHLEDTVKKTAYSLQIIKVDKEEEFNKKFFLKCYNGVPRTPLQELQFEFVKVANSTYVSFKHIFMEPIKFEMISSISKNKIHILGEVKKNLELSLDLSK